MPDLATASIVVTIVLRLACGAGAASIRQEQPAVPASDWRAGVQSARALFGVNARPAVEAYGYGIYAAPAIPGYLPRGGCGYSGAPCLYAGSYGYPQRYGGYCGGNGAERRGYGYYSYYGLSGYVACGAYGAYQPAGYYYSPPPVTSPPPPPPPAGAALPTPAALPTAAPQPAASEGKPAAAPVTPQGPIAPAQELAVCYGRVYDGYLDKCLAYFVDDTSSTAVFAEPAPGSLLNRSSSGFLQISSEGTVEPGLYVYVEPAPVAGQGTIVTAADVDAGQTCYDTATLLPNVVPLLAVVPAAGCGQDIIVSPLSTLLAVGAPVGLTADAVKEYFNLDARIAIGTFDAYEASLAEANLNVSQGPGMTMLRAEIQVKNFVLLTSAVAGGNQTLFMMLARSAFLEAAEQIVRSQSTGRRLQAVLSGEDTVLQQSGVLPATAAAVSAAIDTVNGFASAAADTTAIETVSYVTQAKVAGYVAGLSDGSIHLQQFAALTSPSSLSTVLASTVLPGNVNVTVAASPLGGNPGVLPAAAQGPGSGTAPAPVTGGAPAGGSAQQPAQPVLSPQPADAQPEPDLTAGAPSPAAARPASHAAAIAAGILVPLIVIALAAGAAAFVVRRRRQQRRASSGLSFQITAWSAATYDLREDYVALPVPLRGQFMAS